MSRSIARKLSTPIAGESNQIVTQTVLETGSDNSYTTELRVYKEWGVQNPTDLFNPDVEWQQRESVPLNEDNALAILDLAYSAQQIRESQQN